MSFPVKATQDKILATIERGGVGGLTIAGVCRGAKVSYLTAKRYCDFLAEQRIILRKGSFFVSAKGALAELSSLVEVSG